MVPSYHQSKHTMNKRSLVIVEANASANPALAALILGVTRQTKPVTPTATAESRLKRTESQRFTTNSGEKSIDIHSRADLTGHTSPHPIVRVSILPNIWAYKLIDQGLRANRVDTAKHVTQELRRSPKSTNYRDPRYSFSVNGIEGWLGNRIYTALNIDCSDYLLQLTQSSHISCCLTIYLSSINIGASKIF